MGKLFFALEPQLKRFRGDLGTSKHHGPIEVEVREPRARRRLGGYKEECD
jgi:hypothetical protein